LIGIVVELFLFCPLCNFERVLFSFIGISLSEANRPFYFYTSYLDVLLVDIFSKSRVGMNNDYVDGELRREISFLERSSSSCN
jgi:hypothetical protein